MIGVVKSRWFYFILALTCCGLFIAGEFKYTPLHLALGLFGVATLSFLTTATAESILIPDKKNKTLQFYDRYIFVIGAMCVVIGEYHAHYTMVGAEISVVIIICSAILFIIICLGYIDYIENVLRR